jgi:hypothetical protein
MCLLWTVFCISGQILKYNESRHNGLTPHDEFCYDESLSNGAQIVCPVKL